MIMITWLSENIVEVFGAVTGIAYVILEIRRNILLWPLGILTSAVYIFVFGRNGFYAGMVLQGYYVAISIYGWYAWGKGQAGDPPNGGEAVPRSGRAQGPEQGEGGSELRDKGELIKKETDVRRIDGKTAMICLVTALVLWGLLWFSLDRWTDSPVPLWDGLITSLSVVATWMLTKKILEQWYVWILANSIAVIVYLAMGMYPTAVLFAVYTVMAVIGLKAWGREQGARGMGQGSRQSTVGNLQSLETDD
jgi:nicotinamide mononucleotide transporter